MALCAAFAIISTVAVGAPTVPSLEIPAPEPVLVTAEFPVQGLVTPDADQILNSLTGARAGQRALIPVTGAEAWWCSRALQRKLIGSSATARTGSHLGSGYRRLALRISHSQANTCNPK